MNEQQYQTPVEEQEIDLVELIAKLWHNRGLIIKTTVLFMVVGLMVALFSAKVFSAGCEIVPQTGNSSSSSSLSSLAALAGIRVNNTGNNSTLSPYVYENIVSSVPFRKDLMYTKIHFAEFEEPITLFDYYFNPEYNKPSVGDYIKRYTIGLPGVILGALRGEQEPTDNSNLDIHPEINTMTPDEEKCYKLLGEITGFSLDDKNGYLSLSANMPEPLAAAELAQAMLDNLESYVTRYKIEKVQEDLNFIEERYNEVKAEMEDIQSRRAAFMDANYNITTAAARVQQERLNTEYTITSTVYTDLAAQLEQARINVKETTPVLTVIKPVTVPVKKSKPARAKILVIFTFLGGVIGVGAVLAIPFVAEVVGSEKMNGWIKELPAKEETPAEA
ncbi:MAG: lipopolysaccharide biosynthesis protein [Tidjanibacter sp.]|nr:lipopolysaccharide biosynthesis protein [Tidjanibacter sp.]